MGFKMMIYTLYLDMNEYPTLLVSSIVETGLMPRSIKDGVGYRP